MIDLETLDLDAAVDEIIEAAIKEELEEVERIKANLWCADDIPLEDFTDEQESEVRRILKKVPTEFLENVKVIKSDPTQGAHHGQYIPDGAKILINPTAFDKKLMFGDGDKKVPIIDLAVIHEVGHSVYEALPKEKHIAWQALSGWQKGAGPGQSPPYKERRPGWKPTTSKETHSKDAEFTRQYAGKNSNEDFADAFSYYYNDNPQRVPRTKREFIESLTKKDVEAGGPGSGRHKVFYHGTTEENAKRILREGLTKGGSKQFITTNYNTASHYAEQHEYNGKGKAAVVTIHLPEKYVKQLMHDYGSVANDPEHTFAIKGKLPVEYIKKAEYATRPGKIKGSIEAGGPGSGCHGDACGRPSTGTKPNTKPLGMGQIRTLEEKLGKYGRLAQGSGINAFDYDHQQLPHRGEFFDGAKAGKMEDNSCHGNSCRLWDQEKGKYQIATGFAFNAKEKLWREHTWAVDSKTGKAIETTPTARDKYFGYVMNEKEAKDFHQMNRDNTMSRGFKTYPYQKSK